MKRLTVLRHAKSSRDEPGTADFDRPLNPHGWKSARRMGRELRDRGIRFDLCVASPAARVRETLDGLAEGYGQFGFAIAFEGRIYMAEAATLLGLVRALPEHVESPLLVGHNPGLERLIAMLTRDDDKGLRERIAGKFPTAALASIDLPARNWAEVERSSGTVAELILPKELD